MIRGRPHRPPGQSVRPPGRLGNLVPHRGPRPRAGRDLPCAAERDRRHRARRRDRREHRPADRAARRRCRRRGLPRRQSLVSHRPPLRPRHRTPVLLDTEGKERPGMGRKVARAIRDTAHRRLPVHSGRPHGGDPHLRAHRLPAAAIRRRDRRGGRHLGAVRVLHRPARRQGLRGQPVGRLAHRLWRHDRHQRAHRGGAPDPGAPTAVTTVVAVTG